MQSTGAKSTVMTQSKKKGDKKEKKKEQPEERSGVIELRPQPPARRVTWKEDTVDNEHANKRKSNICCIFHPSGVGCDKDKFSDSPETCSSDDCNEIERSRQSKKEHMKGCSKGNGGEVMKE
jgi:protein phosphatase 1 regulatory subunit 11